ncbi:DUF1648 domain-containing protein [Streptomyces sp. NPDC020807]|uniref:DUF1648 domain-containing protein n=1 Tax=Streptomyces sp. NPDC020807 TaxID=3155119 RepID=UPI00340B6BE4
MNRATPLLRALAVLPFVLALAAHLILFAVWRDELPARLATHFTLADGGRPDGWTSPTAYVLISTALLLALGAGWAAAVRRPSLWGAWATAGFMGGLFVQLLRTNRTSPTASEPLVDLAVAATAAAAAGFAGWALTSLVPREEEPAHAPGAEGELRLPLADGEVAGWSRDVASRTLTTLSVVFLAATPVVLLVLPWPAALFGLLGLLVGVPGLALARVRVTVDRHGLTVRSALFPRPRARVALDDVASASVRDVDPLGELGGWGYRVRAHRTGVVVRSGEALVVRRSGGREFLVTVSDARTAAALLNTLAARDGKI